MKTKEQIIDQHNEFAHTKDSILMGRTSLYTKDQCKAMMDEYASQYSTPQEGRGRYVTDEEIIGRIERLHAASYIKEILRIELTKFRDQIFTSPPEMEREWISVDDPIRPEDGEKVLVHFGKINNTLLAIHVKDWNDESVWQVFFGDGLTANNHENAETITHWSKISPPRCVGDKKDEV